MRMLIVEDERDLARVLRRAFAEEGFSVDVACDGDTGLFNARNWDYDAVVLDLMLPGRDGRSILESLRREKTTPVLVLTAREGVDDKVDLLNRGADDYVTKPFALAEVVARVRSLIRRAADRPSAVMNAGRIEVDTAARMVRVNGRPVLLTAKEYALLELLLLNRGRVVTRTQIYEKIYDENDDTLSNVVDVHVSNLRRKLGEPVIHTRRGVGYVLDG